MSFLARWFSDLSSRERKLMMGFGSVFVLVLLFLIPFGTSALLSSRRDENAALRDAVQRVQAGRAAVQARQARRDAIAKRYAKKAPKLSGFLDESAKDEKILNVPELSDKPELPIGKRYIERGTVGRLSKVAGFPLLKFLEKIEQSGYPLAITRLNMRKRGGDHDLYDVELGVSAYDRIDAVAASPTATGTATGAASAAPATTGTK